MRPSSRLAPRSRPAFTLVEMTVVLIILLGLAAMIVGFAPRMQDTQKVQRGASQLQGWLGVARQWARAARVPTGIRLQPGRVQPNTALPNVNYVTDLQYIQQPPDFVASPGLTPTDFPNVRRIQVANGSLNASIPSYTLVNLEPIPPRAAINPPPGDFSGGYAMSQENLWPVQSGDYFEANGGGLVHRIDQVLSPTTLVLHPPGLPYAITSPTKQYRIIRAPRVLPGEPVLQLPQDVAIDITALPPYPSHSSPFSPMNPNQPGGPTPIDILFAPSGAVLLAGANDKIILWVRDVSKDAAAPGDQKLVTISVRTGLVAAYDVAPGDPYLLTRGGTPTGL
jgi:type II secretory pathway pseudopilin PulG